MGKDDETSDTSDSATVEAAKQFEQTVDPEQLPKDLEKAGEAFGEGAGGALRGTGMTTEALASSVAKAGQALHEWEPGMGEDMAAEGAKAGGAIGESIAGGVGEAGEAVAEVTAAIAGNIIEQFGKAGQDFSSDIQDAGDAIDKLADGNIAGGLKDLAAAGAQGVGHAFEGAGRIAYGVGKGAAEGVYEAGEGIYETAGAVAGPLVDEVFSLNKTSVVEEAIKALEEQQAEAEKDLKEPQDPEGESNADSRYDMRQDYEPNVDASSQGYAETGFHDMEAEALENQAENSGYDESGRFDMTKELEGLSDGDNAGYEASGLYDMTKDAGISDGAGSSGDDDLPGSVVDEGS
ncbi:MAG: hypothetical protein AAGD04_01665 [Pseudomonadota bacterium]